MQLIKKFCNVIKVVENRTCHPFAQELYATPHIPAMTLKTL